MTVINQFRYLEPGQRGIVKRTPKNGFVVAATDEFHPVKYVVFSNVLDIFPLMLQKNSLE